LQVRARAIPTFREFQISALQHVSVSNRVRYARYAQFIEQHLRCARGKIEQIQPHQNMAFGCRVHLGGEFMRGAMENSSANDISLIHVLNIGSE
jgi:hypothetical protein